MSLNTVSIPEESGKQGYSASNNNLSPLLKWHGGKSRELHHILPLIPENFRSYFEPFVGGGSVYTSIQAENYYINDKSHELIDLYRVIVGENRGLFFQTLEEINTQWDMLGVIPGENTEFFIHLYKDFAEKAITTNTLKDKIHGFVRENSQIFDGLLGTSLGIDVERCVLETKKNMLRKISRMRKIDEKESELPEEKQRMLSKQDIMNNIETAIKGGFYMYLRSLYNNHKAYQLPSPLYTAIFLFIRNFAYSGMFRYNSQGEFNVPYGGNTYNNKNFRKKVEYLKSGELLRLLTNTEICNDDFESFFRAHTPTKQDFVFLDPPYDTAFNEYTQNTFGNQDQERLAQYLIEKCAAKWMMIIKKTDFISGLYQDTQVRVDEFEKKYLVDFMGRNKKKVDHLLITNYSVDER